MTNLLLPRLISCDESGFSGNDMLGSGQPYFSYASHDLSLEEAETLLNEARSKFPVQMPELKASKLLKTDRGRALLAHVLDAVEGRYIVTVCDKEYSLACKFFEYIYEPVLKSNSMLFYQNKLHLFVANYLYMQMKVAGTPVEQVAAEFERFMRTLDPAEAPSLFGAATGDQPDPLLGQILRFARGYNVVIANETRNLQRSGSGKWVLDLSISSVASHLRTWGGRHPLIDVVCDDSKPIKELGAAFDAMINRSDEAFIEMGGRKSRLTWNMAGPVRFACSASHAGIQIADLLAGVASISPTANSRPELMSLVMRTASHFNDECLMPDFDWLDLDGDEAPVNWLILEGLAARADRGEDPLAHMGEIYRVAKASVAEFHAKIGRGPKSRS